jgi:peroxiredoxin/predicted 2-oxoglutarate/Fe(II)-dependent dioxygenase YbiX
MPINMAKPDKLPWAVTLGDYLPAWQLPGVSGQDVATGQLVGKPWLLYFFAADDLPFAEQQALALNGVAAELRSLDCETVGVGLGPLAAQAQFARRLGLTYPVVADASGSVARDHGVLSERSVGGRQTFQLTRRVFLVDPNMRVMYTYETADATSFVADALERVRGLVNREPPRHIAIQAPVLLIPNVFDPDFCRQLIQVWETEGNEDSGFMKQVEGKTVGVYDYGHKIRRDHFLKQGPLRDRINRMIYHRVRPEIWKAYNYEVTRFEDFRIACYDAARGGYFRAHRDNTTDGTAHRRFAMSLNLNAGEYEGGYVRFPEFGPHLYRPDTGAACIFSCSLLHEATDVTAGRRFVLLTFLYGEAEARAREEYNRRVGGEYRAVTGASR